MATTLTDTLLEGAANNRHGVVLACQSVPTAPADLPGIYHAVVPGSRLDDWSAASGGAGRTEFAAECAAIGEAMERYSASVCRLEHAPARKSAIRIEDFSLFSQQQRRTPDFPFAQLYDQGLPFARVHSLRDNSEWWVPTALVGITDHPAVSTSNGLATAASPATALLRGLQELIERDAFMVSWLHSVRGRQVALGDGYKAPVVGRGGDVRCVDATPAYSPWPVAVVGGHLPFRGRPRFAIGAACRETWAAAVEKAYLEWAQGTVFVSAFLAANSDLEYRDARNVRSFQDHAAYYSVRPEDWDRVPLFKGRQVEAPADAPHGDAWETLRRGVDSLHDAGIKVFYRDLTSVDLRQLGLWTVRVLSPNLTPLHFHEPWAFLGGRTSEVEWRYPWVDRSELRFPNPLPHPLG